MIGISLYLGSSSSSTSTSASSSTSTSASAYASTSTYASDTSLWSIISFSSVKDSFLFYGGGITVD